MLVSIYDAAMNHRMLSPLSWKVLTASVRHTAFVSYATKSRYYINLRNR